MNKNDWRIYLGGRGAGHYRPFLRWVEANVPVRHDNKGNGYIFVNDLLPYKNQLCRESRHNCFTMTIVSWFNNKVVAFNKVDDFMKLIGQKLTDEQIRKFETYGAHQLWFYDTTEKERKELLSLVGLEEWA